MQIPVVDVRTLLRADTGRDERPTFPNPERIFARSSPLHHRSSFVSGVGPVRPRLKGGAGPWASESYYVDVSSLIRIRLTKVPQDGDLASLKYARLPRPLYRNFHTDGVVGRLEIGFEYLRYRVRGRWVSPVPDDVVLDAPSHLRGAKQEVPLVELGSLFARHLLTSTTRGSPETWWVQAGAPAVITESRTTDFRYAVTTDPGRLSYRWRRHKGVRLINWDIDHGDPSADEVRRLRIHLSRLHSDFSAFGTILALCQAGSLDPLHPPLRRYLIRTAALLNRPARHGFHQAGLLATALAPMQEVYSGVLESLAYLSDLVGDGILREHLDALQTSLGSTYGDFVIKDLVINVTKNETNISGGTIGAVSTGGGDAHGAVSTGSGTAHAGPAGADVGVLLESLVREVAGLRPHLAEEDATLAEDTLDGVVQELERPEEERSESKLSARFARLLSLAGAAGAAGSTVATAIEALRAAIGG